MQKPLSEQPQQEDEIIVPVYINDSPRRNLPNLPLPDLLNGREGYFNVAAPLYDASIRGDWKAAKLIFDERPEAVRCSINENCETALLLAVSVNRSKQMDKFIINLVGVMEKEDLELQDRNSNNAFCIAAASGNVELLDVMLNKNHRLLTIPGIDNMMPIYIAALHGNHDTVEYLYDKSKSLRDDGLTPENRKLLVKCVEADLFDVALRIVEDFPELDSRVDVLGVLARKPDAFSETTSSIINWVIGMGAPIKERDALRLLRIVWKNIVRKPKNEIEDRIRGPADTIKKDDRPPYGKEDQNLYLLKLISENLISMHVEIQKLVGSTSKVTTAPSFGNEKNTYSSHILFVATEMGNTRFVVELIRRTPHLIQMLNDNNETIFHTAVKHRREGIYSLLYEIGSRKNIITPIKDVDNNNMLHLAGMLPNKNRLQDVSGVALQMQRELLWFKEVETMVPPFREQRNKYGLTPHELFTEEHKDLFYQSEKWMKDTASQCMVVAALIATIVFATAFTVPGGYNQNDGIPVFHSKATFMVFVVADAISLFLSSASIIMFLSILTSRYAERDFLESLPRKLLLGLTTLFLSITTMTIAFTVSFFVLYKDGLIWTPILISMFAGLPVFLFAWLQFPLLADVHGPAYGSKYLFRPKKLLYYRF